MCSHRCAHTDVDADTQNGQKQTNMSPLSVLSCSRLHRELCSLFQPDTDGTRVSKYGQLSQQTRKLDPMLFQCWSSAVGGGPILKQPWVKSSRLLGSTQVSVYTHPSPPYYSRQPIRVLLARQPANHKLTTILEIESGGHMTSTIRTF